VSDEKRQLGVMVEDIFRLIRVIINLIGADVLRPGAPTLEEKYGENWTQLRLRPLGFYNFRETGFKTYTMN